VAVSCCTDGGFKKHSVFTNILGRVYECSFECLTMGWTSGVSVKLIEWCGRELWKAEN